MMKQYSVLLFTLIYVFMVPSILARSVRNETNNEETDDKIAQLGITSTRRKLQQCEANNLIDKCWRCKPDWAQNRQELAKCALGFAKGTTGGQGGEIYIVTDPSDDDAANPKTGTLRFGVIQNKPLWITFEKDMIISLKHELVINKDKTIDGRGVKVEIANGAGFILPNVTNVIIHGVHMHDIKATEGGLIKAVEDKPAGPRHKTDGDGITIHGSSKIWIDHCSLSKGVDGLIDVTLGSTDITVSNCKFTQHQKVMLFGSDDKYLQDKNMQATVAFNMFTDGCDQRMPRCRLGLFQVVNNNYDQWGFYALGGSAAPTILSHGNRFFAPNDPIKKNVVRKSDAPEAELMTWNWRSQKDSLENGAIFVPSGSDPMLTPEQQGLMIQAEPGESVPKLTSNAGALSCVPGQPC
ncbi:putative pectate lyase [Helianthus debilis subsp. tardiflorus]